MSIDVLQKRYGLSIPEIEGITSRLLSCKSLKVLQEIAPHLSLEQLYVVASHIAVSQFGERIEFIAPLLTVERAEMAEPLKEGWVQQRQQRIEQRQAEE
ncbi:hypothetical protein [Ferrimonas marina]|nr:hypothetical protein [Ferrimonas marina]